MPLRARWLRRNKHSNHGAKPDDKPLPSNPTNKTISSDASSVLHTASQPNQQSQKPLSVVDPVPDSHTSDPASRNRIISKNRDRRSDPLGLNVIYEPGDSPTIDIIFVHGLGGTSQQTWSKNKDPTLFWPKEWLPFERNISTARVLSFGYNAHFAAAGSNIFNISDFAKELLFGMKFGMDKQSKLLGVGKVPIIFVAHSMGGLVVKKAYIIGQNDLQYQDIVQSTCSIIFLATPHLGSNLAEVLNVVLQVSIFYHSPKQYIAELKANSPTLQEINEQFQKIATNLQIISFFETMPTSVGLKKMMIVERESSTLGYPGEITKPLNADHHDVCKYSNKDDSNYKSVRDVLSSMVERFRKKAESSNVSTEQLFQKIKALLNICEAPEEDLGYFLGRKMEGSCEWILKNNHFQSWREGMSQKPEILWLGALPGTGKSVLSASVIQHLRRTGLDCSFYFFRYGNQTRTSLNAFLRSMAYQTAYHVPGYGRRLAELSDNGFNFEKTEARILWQKLFTEALFKANRDDPLYWVIDGLDESDSPMILLSLLSSTESSNIPLRILLVSRKSQTLVMSFERLSASINIQHLPFDDSVLDLKLYVDKEMGIMRATPQFKEYVTSKIMKMAKGNFLWVHLVLKEIMLCFTEADVEKALRDLPAELEPHYQRMEASLAKQPRGSDQNLAKVILTWACCSRRPLSLPELSQALLPEHQPALDLQHTIDQACGEFVNVDGNGNVTMIHQTARDYLTKTPGLRFSIRPPEAHYTLFKKCLSFLCSTNTRTRMELVSSQPFLLYAATSWTHHLSLSSAAQDHASLFILAKFLRSPSVLTWIHCLALAGQLRILVLASKILMSFLEKRARIDKEEIDITYLHREKETIKLWAIDLIKVVGKFGTHLVSQPKSIYKLVPPFCPRDSIMHRQFGPKVLSPTLRVSGLTNNSWDENLAKFSVGRDSQAVKIECLENYFAILLANGTVILYHSMTYEELRRFIHGERVLVMQFNNAGDKLVTYGFRTTRVWSLSSARQLYCISNPSGTKALAAIFTANDTAILTCSDDRVIRQWSLLGSPDCWVELLGDNIFGNHHHNSPNCVAFNQEGTQVALAYRGFPLSVWGIERPGIVGMCERPGNVGLDLWTGVDRVGWNSVTGHVVGIYSDGCVFKWHPEESDNQELKTVALEIECSPDGNILVTCSSDGTLQIWNFHLFALIYHLSCTPPVTDLAIDPDGRRIYDLRDSFCNIWEPNCFIRLTDADEKAGETSSAIRGSRQLPMISGVSVEVLEPITALAINPQTSAYCAGNDEGTVTFSKIGSNDVVALSQNFMTVTHIIWSEDESTLITADLSGRISVKSLDVSSTLPREQALFQIPAQGRIYQILLSSESKYLLVYTSESAQIWTINSKKLTAIHILQNSSIRWANSPHAEEHLLCFGFNDVRIFNWTNFEEVGSLQINRQLIDEEFQGLAPRLFLNPSENEPASPEESETLVNKTFMTSDQSIMLIETSRAADNRQRQKQFMIIKTSDLSSDGSENVIMPSRLPDDILTHIEMPLGFLDGHSIKTFWTFSSRCVSDPTSSPKTAVLAFLDKNFWVCTGLLNGGGTLILEGVKRHFFLPRDWLNTECLELAIMTKDGTLFCPRNGEVAVIRDGFKEEWFE